MPEREQLTFLREDGDGNTIFEVEEVVVGQPLVEVEQLSGGGILVRASQRQMIKEVEAHKEDLRSCYSIPS